VCMQWLIIVLIVIGVGRGLAATISHELLSQVETVSLELSGVNTCQALFENEEVIYDARAKRYRDKQTGRFIKVDADLNC